jgi:MoxR-like ATPase
VNPEGATVMGYDPAGLVQRARTDLVGMEREAEVLSVALAAGRHVVLEGPPGTGKSTLLRAIADQAGVSLVFVEGNAELTPSRLVGSHDPAMVLQGGYRPEAFTPGPLVEAVRDGGLLYLEELNRIPEETLNVLITALAEGELHVPRLGRIPAAPTFRLIAAMNPFDAIGTGRIGQALYDRLCRIAISYQSETAEREITTRATRSATAASASTGAAGVGPTPDEIEIAVIISRATRSHADLRTGSSVRGAIDLALLADGLRRLRGLSNGSSFADRRDVLLDASLAAMTGRVRVDEASDRTAEDIVTEIVNASIEEFIERRRRRPDGDSTRADDHDEQDSGQGKGDGPSPSLGQEQKSRGQILSGDDARKAVEEAARRTNGRAELQQRHENFDDVSPGVGELNDRALEDFFDEDADAAASLLADMANATDRALRAKARALACRVFLRMAKREGKPRPGVRRLSPSRDPFAGDLDLELTLAHTDGLMPSTADEFVVRRWTANERAICLLIDRSGSMTGAQVATAALAAASVVVAAGEHADCSVVAFAKEAIVLQEQGRRRPTDLVLSDLLSLRGKGETDLSLAFRAARRELGRAGARDRVAILLSDGKSTTGSDPLGALRGVDRLHVLGTSEDEESVAWGQRLARAGRGQYRQVLSISALPGALSAIVAE